MNDTAPRKFDHGKPQLNLIPTVALVEMGKVLAMGAQKYDRGNWAKGLATSRYFDACQRHLLAWNSGENVDPESGISHLAHAMVNLAFMLWNMTFRKDLDDRWHTAVPAFLAEPVAEIVKELRAAEVPAHTLKRYGWFFQGIKDDYRNLRSPLFVSVDLCHAFVNNVEGDLEDPEGVNRCSAEFFKREIGMNSGAYTIEEVEVDAFGKML